MEAEHGGLPDHNVNIAGSLLDARLEQLVNQNGHAWASNEKRKPSPAGENEPHGMDVC
jgi:hypothetical protein